MRGDNNIKIAWSAHSARPRKIPEWIVDVCENFSVIEIVLSEDWEEHQISAGQLSADSSSTETLYCFK